MVRSQALIIFEKERWALDDVVNAVFLKSGLVMLARRSRTRRLYPNLWSFPGGHIEAGENSMDALSRELMEEIGVRPIETEFLRLISDPKLPEKKYHMFAVRDWEGRPAIQDREHTELRWFTLDAAAALKGLALSAYRELFAYVIRRGLAD